MGKSVKRIAMLTVAAWAVVAAVPVTGALAFDPYYTLEGVVEQLPERAGETVWTIGGRAVRVDPTTRIEGAPVLPAEGYWAQSATGVLVRAPGWTPDQASAAGFRPASPAEAAQTLGAGHVVRAKLRPGHEEPLLASEIRFLAGGGEDRADHRGHRAARAGRHPLGE